MDYERVYREFIADRRLRRPVEIPLEEHHIVPRALGGRDDPDNLIRLVLQDHLFAHVLLAKIHGGPMAVALVNMLGFRRYRGRHSRFEYERLKIEARRYLSKIGKGREVTNEARVKMRTGQLARCADPIAREVRDKALYHPDAVAKAKLGGKAYWDDPERRASMVGNTRSTGRVLSEVHKQRISEGLLAYSGRRRLEREKS